MDEVLSVGDSWFQHKSMARMKRLMKNNCTVIFVSHSIDAVRALCNKVIWMHDGAIRMMGDVTSVTNHYMNDVFVEHNRIVIESLESEDGTGCSSDSEIHCLDNAECRYGYDDGNYVSSVECGENQSADCILEPVGNLLNDEGYVDSNSPSVLKVVGINIIDNKNIVTSRIEQGENFSIEIKIQFFRSMKNISVGFIIKDRFGQELTGESYFNIFRKSIFFEAGQVVRFVFSSTMMLRGGESYSVALRVNQVSRWDRSDNIVIYSDELAAVFDVLSNPEAPMWFKFKQPFTVSVENEE